MIYTFPSLTQSSDTTDVATYQLGVVAEALPGSNLNYKIIVTNHGPTEVSSFYILDGWTINDEGVSGFAQPVSDPDFGDFAVLGSWRRNEEDQIVLAWLLEGALAPGETLQFDWLVQVDNDYRGVLVNWVGIQTEGTPQGSWQGRTGTSSAVPPEVGNAVDSNIENNRTTDGVTVVTTDPTGEGVDLAIYQTDILTQLTVDEPLTSTWLVANLGPQPVQQFYVMAGWSLAADGGSILMLPALEPDFGEFNVLGSWSQSASDEQRWLWLLEGELASGSSVSFEWTRNIIPVYQGDLINRAEIELTTPPSGEWLPRLDTVITPPDLDNRADTFPENNRSDDALTIVGS